MMCISVCMNLNKSKKSTNWGLVLQRKCTTGPPYLKNKSKTNKYIYEFAHNFDWINNFSDLGKDWSITI